MLQAQYWAKFAILQGLGLLINYQDIMPIESGYKANGELSWLHFKIKNQPNFNYEFNGYELVIENLELKIKYIIIVTKN